MPRQTRSQSRSVSRDVSPELVELDFSRGKPVAKKTIAKQTRKSTRRKQGAAAKAVQPPSPSPPPRQSPAPNEPTPREITSAPREATPPPPAPSPSPPPPTMLPSVPEEPSPERTPVRINSPFQSIFSKVSDSVKGFLFRSPSSEHTAPSPSPETPTPTEKMDIPTLNDIVLPDKPEYHETPRMRGQNGTPRTAPVRRIQRPKTPKTVPARKPCPAVTEIPALKEVPGVKTPTGWWYDRAKGIAPGGRVVQPHTQRHFQKKIKEYDDALAAFERTQAAEQEAQIQAEEQATQESQQQVMAEIQAGKDEGKRVYDDGNQYQTRVKNGVKEIHVPEDMLKTLPPISNPTGGGYGMDLDYFDDEEEELIWVSQEFWEQNRVDAAPPNKKRRLAERYPDRVKPAEYTDDEWETVLKYGTHPDPDKQSTFGVPEYDDDDTSMLDLTDDGIDQTDISMMSAGSTAGRPSTRPQASTPTPGLSNIFNMPPAKTPTTAGPCSSREQAETSPEKEQRSSPPPPPRPAHAQLPKGPETPARSSMDPVARQRSEAQKYKPVQPSRLRDVSAASPASLASSPPGSVLATPQGVMGQEPFIVTEEMITNAALAGPVRPLSFEWPTPRVIDWGARSGLSRSEADEVKKAVMAVEQEKVEKQGLSWFTQLLAGGSVSVSGALAV